MAMAQDGDAAYSRAMAAERDGDHAESLRILRSLRRSKPSCPRLAADVRRVIDGMYGVRGSDSAVSLWRDAPLKSTTEPTPLQCAAYVTTGRRVLRHGGLDFTAHEEAPSRDELWEFDVDARRWRLLETAGAAGSCPGPRSGHSAFVWGEDVYVFGGVSRTGLFCGRLFRLRGAAADERVAPFRWESVKTRGRQRPDAREEHAGVVYRGKYYVLGGLLGDTRRPTDDFWCLDLSTFKWTPLRRNPVRRNCAGMWAARGKIYVLGGRTHKQGGGGLMDFSTPSLEEFVSFDIKSKTWTYEDVLGDRPHDLSEFTVLPLYNSDGDEEPASIIVWGGYGEDDRQLFRPGLVLKDSLKDRYGDEIEDFTLQYRRRLLRFDVATNVWRKLKPTTDVLPKAQSFAAVSKCKNGVISLLIGGGYGFVAGMGDTPPTASQKVEEDKMARMAAAAGCNIEEAMGIMGAMGRPKASNKVYEVSISQAFGKGGGLAWCWDLYNLSDQNIPRMAVDLSPLSPTLHHATEHTYKDFMHPPCGSVKPDDQGALMGVRARLCNLNGRKELNGKVGRIGSWLKEQERYQVFFASGQSVSVRPSNLDIAGKLSHSKLPNLLMGSGSSSMMFPTVIMTVFLQAPSGKLERPLLEELVDPRPMDGSGVNTFFDTYRGPVNGRAQAILRTVARSEGSILSCSFMAMKLGNPTSTGQAKLANEFMVYSNFVKQVIDEDTVHVRKLEKTISALDESKVTLACGNCLRLSVQLDGIIPPIRRELLVSPDLTMRSLHNQVLCPALGYKPNYHCYAFRNITIGHDSEVADYGQLDGALQILDGECWIGPRISTALDSMFMPLYIGGCLANDKNITIGKLFAMNQSEDGQMHLQYINDFGDWLSHSICVTKCKDSNFSSNSSVVRLIDGEGAGVGDDVGGIMEYSKKICQLTGRLGLEHDDGSIKLVDPNSEHWWKLLNGDIRRNSHNLLSNPLCFNLERTQAAIDASVRAPAIKAGKESKNLLSVDAKTGLQHEFNKKCTVSVPKDRTKLCAICGVTVALKLCSRCFSVAYCSREHQLEHWQQHKSECKQLKKIKQAK